jgi:hypothetical protein
MKVICPKASDLQSDLTDSQSARDGLLSKILSLENDKQHHRVTH